MHNAATCPTCQATALTRNHYFTGKLMVERDFTDEQVYFRERLRLHNQRLHGTGVVCGLGVKQHPNPACQDRFVILEPGSAIDCCGADILVTADDTIDLWSFPAVKELYDAPDEEDHVLQLAICYRECPTEEIPVLYDDCACDDSQCAPNRILESYSIDVIVDPVTPPAIDQQPTLTRAGTLGITAPRAVVLDEAGGRVFVLSPTAIYELDATTQAVTSSFSLGQAGLAMAISRDGTVLYAFVAPASPGADGEIWFFDTANLAAGVIDSAPVAGGGAETPWVTMTWLDTLLAAYPSGKLCAWQVTDAANAPSESLSLAAGITSIVASSDGARAWVARGTDTLDVLDLTVAGFNPAPLQVPGTTLTVLAVLSSTLPDRLAAGDGAGAKLHVIDPAKPSGTAPLASAGLAASPVAMVGALGGGWVYVVETNDAIEVIDVGRLLQGLPVVPPPPLAIGIKPFAVVLATSGLRMYVPYAGGLADGSDSGVAVIDILPADCGAPLRRVRPCPGCGSADCVVVATIRNYHPGRRLLDKTEPAPSAATDAANSISRIDELDGRKILASTEMLQEVIECMLAHGGSGGGWGHRVPRWSRTPERPDCPDCPGSPASRDCRVSPAWVSATRSPGSTHSAGSMAARDSRSRSPPVRVPLRSGRS
ncbi:MAG: hypothetical protein WKG01_09990 [Kofleriaceae bacterium]